MRVGVAIPSYRRSYSYSGSSYRRKVPYSYKRRRTGQNTYRGRKGRVSSTRYGAARGEARISGFTGARAQRRQVYGRYLSRYSAGNRIRAVHRVASRTAGRFGWRRNEYGAIRGREGPFGRAARAYHKHGWVIDAIDAVAPEVVDKAGSWIGSGLSNLASAAVTGGLGLYGALTANE